MPWQTQLVTNSSLIIYLELNSLRYYCYTMGKRKREEEEVFQVEVILAARVNDECDWEYLIRWAGYGEEDDTWEPTKNIAKNCQRLILSFWKNVGMDDEDYHPGDECTPTDDWIEMERKIFYEDQKMKKTGKPPKAKKRKRSRSVKRLESEEGSPLASSSKVDYPLVKREPSEDNTILTVKKTRQVLIVSDSDSDEPLAKKSSSAVAAKRIKIPSTLQSNKQSRKRDAKKEAIPRSLSPSGSLFSDSEAPDIASSPSHAISAPSTQAQSSGHSVKRPSKPTQPQLKISIPSQVEQSTSSPNVRPPTSTPSASNSPNVSVKIPNFLRVPSSFNEPSSASGSNLSVKSRLYQTAIVPMKPKNASVESSRVKPSLVMGAAAAKRSSLSNLNFKKKSAAVGASPTITSDDLRPRIPSFSSPDPSPVISPHVPSFAATATSPVSANRIPRNDPTMAALNAAPPSPIDHMAGLSLNSPSSSGIANDFMPPVNSTDQTSFPIAEVDSFLQSVMPMEMAAPFETTPVEADDDAMPLPIRTSLSTSERPTTITGKTQMKWKWTGEIQIQSEREGEVKGEDGQPSQQFEVQFLCIASITDTVQLTQGGMPFRVVLSEDVTSLTFQTFLPIDHLEDVLLACKPEAAARFVSAEGKEGGGGSERFAKFADYLQTNKQVAISPVYMDDIHTANIMCFPPTFLNRIERLVRVLTEFATAVDTSSGLVLVLFSWVLSREQLSEHNLRMSNNQPLQPELERQFPDLVSDVKLLKNPESKCTVGILGYPQWLHGWLKEWQRSFSIWPGGVDNNNGHSGSLEFNASAATDLEINLLHSLLTKCELAATAPIESEDASIARVIFIHAQGLGSISKLPHLRRRRETVETMFVVFGTSSPSGSVSLSQGQWPSCGFWEVYPIGGVVTFTAKALLQHPDVILTRTQQIAEYPLWTSYIIPTVLGMAVTLYYRARNEDPMEAFDRDDFAYEFLLDAIHEGEVGLLRCPPPISNITTKHWKATDEHGDHPSTILNRHYENDNDEDNWRDPRSEWFLDQIDSVFRERRETLAYCLKEFERVYGTISPQHWDTFLGKEIADDIKRMQVQPAIAREYRRYVVLKAEEEKAYDDELEWQSPDMFEVYNESGTPPPDSPSAA
ncbi:hypothetical protein E1B28_003924 [Marasmius oreades]|uniref:Chromo domain-containing protein n=1 Tax=Marasmius oreades TaxID=181124 RepID=A0A9P8ABX0_9AGAR|nr:uncharacterized protein E1B28_003924 [Marasmius oreades]KAG7096494.1 hypothetical protein E1B28_003924 [Marasmius oreades]